MTKEYNEEVEELAEYLWKEFHPNYTGEMHRKWNKEDKINKQIYIYKALEIISRHPKGTLRELDEDEIAKELWIRHAMFQNSNGANLTLDWELVKKDSPPVAFSFQEDAKAICQKFGVSKESAECEHCKEHMQKLFWCPNHPPKAEQNAKNQELVKLSEKDIIEEYRLQEFPEIPKDKFLITHEKLEMIIFICSKFSLPNNQVNVSSLEALRQCAEDAFKKEGVTTHSRKARDIIIYAIHDLISKIKCLSYKEIDDFRFFGYNANELIKIIHYAQQYGYGE